MQAVFRVRYDSFVAEVSGAELEVFQRVIMKMVPCNDHYGTASEKVELKDPSNGSAPIGIRLCAGTIPFTPETPETPEE